LKGRIFRWQSGLFSSRQTEGAFFNAVFAPFHPPQVVFRFRELRRKIRILAAHLAATPQNPEYGLFSTKREICGNFAIFTEKYGFLTRAFRDFREVFHINFN